MKIEEWFVNQAPIRRAMSVCQRWKRVFLHLYLYAAAIYLPLIVLRLTNFLDGMWDQDDHLAGAAELRIGRWFWPWLDRLRFGVSLDPLPAILSIALFVIGVLMILSLMRKTGETACSCASEHDTVGPARQSDRTACDSAEDHCGSMDLEPVHLSLTEYLAGALMLTTPAVLSQLSYSYMSITFSTAFLLAVLAVWAAAVPCEKAGILRQAFRISLSAVLIALMMGLYQACLGALCVAALAYFIFQLDGTCGGKDCCIRRGLRFALRMLIALVIGAALYEILLQIHLTAMGETLSDYKGASSVSLFGIVAALPSSIRHCLSAFKAYFSGNLFIFNALQGGKLFYLLYLVPAFGALLYVAKLLRSGAGAVWKCILLVMAGLLIPIFANSFFLLATETDTAVQMTGGMSLVIPLLLLAWNHVELPGTSAAFLRTNAAGASEALCNTSSGKDSCTCNKGAEQPATAAPDTPAKSAGYEPAQEDEKSAPRNRLPAAALGVIVTAGSVLLLYGAIGQAAIDQYAMYAGRQATTTLAKSVLNEFAVYGVDYDYNVVLVYGAPADSPTFAVGDLYWQANLYAQYGNWGNEEETNRLCWGHFFDQQLRVSMNYAEGETLHTIMTSDEVAAMSVFPASGSAQNVWGVTVVKVADDG